jgi:hypothetical protein
MPEFKPLFRIWQISQSCQDRWSSYVKLRWLVFVGLMSSYMVRIAMIGGFYVVTYALAIYLLNLLVGFLIPARSDLDNEENDNPILPTSEGDEFRPLIRKIPEFRLWFTSCRGTGVALALTFFEAFDIPVFWPILVMYFIGLFLVTLKRQISHMVKHKYLPWQTGKEDFRPKT